MAAEAAGAEAARAEADIMEDDEQPDGEQPQGRVARAAEAVRAVEAVIITELSRNLSIESMPDTDAHGHPDQRLGAVLTRNWFMNRITERLTSEANIPSGGKTIACMCHRLDSVGHRLAQRGLPGEKGLLFHFVCTIAVHRLIDDRFKETGQHAGTRRAAPLVDDQFS